MESLSQPLRDVSGTAFFELHLVDALVRDGEPLEEFLLQFAEERVNFAHAHMDAYAPLGT